MGRAGQTYLRLGLLTLCPLLLSGCMRTRTLTPPTPHPVTVRVTWKGEPVRYVIVNMEQVVPSQGAEADGCTDENGVFEPRSFANDGSKDGLVPGKYRVILEPYDPARLVSLRPLPRGARMTQLPAEEWNPGVEVEFREGDTELKVDIP